MSTGVSAVDIFRAIANPSRYFGDVGEKVRAGRVFDQSRRTQTRFSSYFAVGYSGCMPPPSPLASLNRKPIEVVESFATNTGEQSVDCVFSTPCLFESGGCILRGEEWTPVPLAQLLRPPSLFAMVVDVQAYPATTAICGQECVDVTYACVMLHAADHDPTTRVGFSFEHCKQTPGCTYLFGPELRATVVQGTLATHPH